MKESKSRFSQQSGTVFDNRAKNVKYVSTKGVKMLHISSARWARKTVFVLLAVVVVASLATTAVFAYNKIVVVEPSQNVASLKEVMTRADFPLWVSGMGKLTRIQDIGDGQNYNVILQYTLDDGRKVYISESSSYWHLDKWDTVDPARLLERDIEINGYKGVLSLNQVTRVDKSTNSMKTELGSPSLHWDTDTTALWLSVHADNVLTRDELVAIAKSMRKANSSQ
ncbi:MAG: hypothetical protein HY327_00290 [Chloroflexi bacterium]|nr:hypothetical protein [Chloroflexota bacterium]